MYHPKVSNPAQSSHSGPMLSGGYQPLFYFGATQTPINIGLAPSQFQGSRQIIPQDKQVDFQTYSRLLSKKQSPVRLLKGA
jgi:hypothetical protein